MCKKCFTPFSCDPAGARVRVTQRVDVRARKLRLEFHDAAVSLVAGERRGLGRDPRFSPDAELFGRFGTVSGRHASLELREDGTAWISDEESTNSTYVNGIRLTPRLPHPLHDGDKVRFALDVHATVRLAAR